MGPSVGGKPHKIQELVELEGFGQRQRDALAHALFSEVVTAVCGNHDDRNERVIGQSVNRLSERDAVDVRHHQVRDDQIEHRRLENLERLERIRGSHDAVAMSREKRREHVQRRLVVINDENLPLRCGASLGLVHARPIP